MLNDRAKALLLDFDGTLADSLDAMWNAYAAFAARFSFAPGRAEFAELNGPPLRDVVAVLVERHGLDIALQPALEAYVDEVSSALAQVNPSHGAAALLEAARANDWRVAVVTSNNRTRVEAWLENAGMMRWIETVVGDDVSPVKPDPTPYRVALARLACSAATSLAVDDSVLGHRAAVGAGVRAVLYRPLDREPGPSYAQAVESFGVVAEFLADREPCVRIRLATSADRPFLFGLRNDPSVIGDCHTARALRYDELNERFRLDATLREKVTLIAMARHERIGMIRFDRKRDGYEVSIIIDGRWRGAGHGRAALRAAIDAFFAMRGPVRVVADVADSNAASARLFAGCGFVRDGGAGRFLQFVRLV